MSLDVDQLCDVLADFANMIFARYGHPVYLVGSALEKENTRDVDIRVLLPDKEFFNRFGSFHSARWAAECGKAGRWCGVNLSGMNIDFQVNCESVEDRRYEGRPRRRIDTAELAKI